MTSFSSIRSQPTYPPLTINPAARATLFVTDAPCTDPAWFATGTSPSAFDKLWVVTGGSRTLPQPQGGVTTFRATTQLLETLAAHLKHECMGLRLYAAGAEPFIWSVARIAQQAGMSAEEYALLRTGAPARTVMCAHCHTLTSGATTTLLTCSGCGARLEVRDHFSRRLGAYLGVQADAEQPGVFPPSKELSA